MLPLQREKSHRCNKKLFFASSDVAGMPFPHSGERGNLLQPTGDSNAAGDQ